MKIIKAKIYFLIATFILFCSSLAAQSLASWKIKDVSIQTRWSYLVSSAKPLPEYPRPQLIRDGNWQNLNGLWDYTITGIGEVPKDWADTKILVPYPIESALSGVKKSLLPHQTLWYRRTFSNKAIGDNKTLLHFGAVDYKAKVIINGKEVGRHEGGYTAFTFDITKFLRDGKNELIVAVEDPSDQGIGPHGKQVLNPSDIYYTPTSGIWQTVWLEIVPLTYIKSLRITPDVDNQNVKIEAIVTSSDNEHGNRVVNGAETSDYTIEAMVMVGSEVFGSKKISKGQPLLLPMKNARLWSPDDPFLYDLVIRVVKDGKVCDEISSYFGMRKIDIQKDNKGVARIYLNNKYYFNLGVLDQGFWPDGLYTAPTDAALKFDIEAAKVMGFNTIRKHIKIEPARWYYHADKLGMLVWQDFVNPNQGLVEGAKPAFENQVLETVNQLYNQTCITTWVIFNEKWGQYDQLRIANWVKGLDRTRLVNAHSGELLYVNNKLRSPSLNPFEGSDMTDVHSYPFPRIAPLQERKAMVLGEFGGIGVPVEGHLWDDLVAGWGYDGVVSPDTMRVQLSAMLDSLKVLEASGLSASIYTQPYDVESEQNGLMTYDREVAKLPFTTIRQLNSKIWPATENFELSLNEIRISEDNVRMPGYNVLLERFKKESLDKNQLRALAVRAKRRNDSSNLAPVSAAYIRKIQFPLADNDIKLLNYLMTFIGDPTFKFVINQFSHIGTATPESKGLILKACSLISSEIKPKVTRKNIDMHFDFDSTNNRLFEHYGAVGLLAGWQNEALYYYLKEDVNRFVETKVKIHNKFPDVISTYDLNNDSWFVFQHSNDPNLLLIAIDWSRKVIELEPTANYYDTYANLLYKTGKREKAISIQEKGLTLETGNGAIEAVKENLIKMKNNIPTWKQSQ